MSHPACIPLYQSSEANRVKGQKILTLSVALREIQTLRYTLASAAIFIWEKKVQVEVAT